jgi:hypothetical protein
MLWVGIATLIMLISGTGDDTHTFRKRMAALEQATRSSVVDTKRQKAAQTALKDTSQAFFAHRKRLDRVGQCITQLDARYQVTRADYEACMKDLDNIWDDALSDFVAAEHNFRAAVAPEELTHIYSKVIKP